MPFMLLFGDRMAGLATVCASILCLVPAQRVSADPPELALALEGGVAWSHSSHTYQFFDPEDGPNDAGSVSVLGPAGALHFELSWKAASILRVGGFARLAFAGAPENPFSESLGVQGTIGLGVTLRLEPEERTDGPYGGLWVGFGGVVPHGAGFVGGVDAGYRWLLGERWSIGLGGSVSTQWSFFGESGDHGRYEYTQGAVWPAVHLRVAHL